VFVPYRDLYSKSLKGTIHNKNSAAYKLITSKPEWCGRSAERKLVLSNIANAVNNHQGKLGLILPLTGQRAGVATHILDGLKAAFNEAGIPFNSKVVLKDSAANPTIAVQKLAELVFNDQVTVVMGGMELPVAEQLISWSEKLQIPTFVISREREIVRDSKQAFRIYPDEKRLARTLALAVKQKSFKRVAVLRPTNRKSDSLVSYFKAAVVAAGSQISEDLMYTPGNFDSMEAVSRQLFGIDLSTRKDEFRRAYRAAKRRAQKANVPFNPRMVSLKPIVNFDAVFIPDDFRTVRHFAKLFKYHGVSNLKMIGNHEWRSPALVSPWDEFMQDAVFADFIGSYTKLPNSISVPTVGSPYFIDARHVIPVDFRLIGYRSGKIAEIALRNSKLKRRQVSKALMALQSPSVQLFGKGNVFDEEHSCIWPTYLFDVANENVVLNKSPINLEEIKIGSRRTVRPNPNGKFVRRAPAPIRTHAQAPNRRQTR
jgi:hypothetical protein